jgi:uncharacterized protein YjcR
MCTAQWKNGSSSKPREGRKGGAPKGNQNANGNKGGGRKTSYKPAYAECAKTLCAVGGYTDKNLAEAFDVSEMTINRWLKHVEFQLAVKAGKSSMIWSSALWSGGSPAISSTRR